MKKCLFAILLLSATEFCLSQSKTTDSLEALLATSHQDSNKVRLMWQLANEVNNYNPERALTICQNAIFLAHKIKDIEGESRSLGIQANTFMLLGNYPRALEFNFKKLQIEEKRQKPKNLASVLMNIGAVYTYQEDYRQALIYYYRSDSVIRLHQVNELRYYSALNLGDIYDRLNIPDSAYPYFNRSLEIANTLKDGDLIGTSMTGIAHIYRKQHKFDLSLPYYKTGIVYLEAAQDDQILCEATLGLAQLFENAGQPDSAAWYAHQSLAIAIRDGFISRELEAAEFLTDHYKSRKNIDSSFAFISRVKLLNDSINSKARIREMQILSSNEQLRQLEIEEAKKSAAKERRIQLQLLFIGMFIPGFFLLTLLLSRIRMHIRVIKVLGVLSLLILFEYLTLLLHPYVAEITHHTPVLEMLIFVSIAAILIPAHHRIEHLLIEKLVAKRSLYNEKKIRLKTVKLKPLKKP
jgi:tetratricopeptide (TPR) repeat protein